jgi:hypothetical protein
MTDKAEWVGKLAELRESTKGKNEGACRLQCSGLKYLHTDEGSSFLS